MNRETKRMMDRRGRSDAESADDDELEAVAVAAAPARSRSADRARGRRSGPVQFAREIREELRQVAWPTRGEMVNYSAVVLVTLVVMISLIFLLNFAFGKGVLFMFHK